MKEKLEAMKDVLKGILSIIATPFLIMFTLLLLIKAGDFKGVKELLIELIKLPFYIIKETLLILALPAIGVLLIMGFQNKFGEQELDENGKPRPKHPASIEDFLPI
jgi:hypothetical protein